jgi:hypothetical protein
MQYLFVILIPVLILGANYWASKQKPKTVSEWANLILRTLPHEWGYAFFVYYIDMEQKVNTGWAFLTLVMILLPLTVVILFLKLFYWLKSKNMMKRQA